MRVVGEIPHPDCKITLFAWNNRYLIKFEQGLMEQTFKINEYDITAEADLRTLINEEFIRQTLTRFEEMETSLRDRLNVIG
ncbi:hypothetical protein [Ohtaekwangia koreensis]|uniref:Uncharacterized protein n=1 Tax=Ohtaekwangia koreensis TaxID=688867 RepID=A0A1T5JZ70_9BACT|nr:hypothetical protein [Ohtaekwangia koreensis]SKC56644.1 hypothetical protein SAMN05660236_1622 [Ohtaekwangia koreensis]